MAKRPTVLCRECRQRFQRDDLVEGVDWVMPSKNWYYHKECYDTWVNKRKHGKNITVNKKDEEYRLEIFDYLSRNLKVPFNGAVVDSQMKTMLKKGRTLKGILFSLIYWYDIKQNKWNPKYEGIWMAELVYDQSRAYWQERVHKQSDILDKIEEQIKTFRELPRIPVKKQEKKKWKSRMIGVDGVEDE